MHVTVDIMYHLFLHACRRYRFIAYVTLQYKQVMTRAQPPLIYIVLYLYPLT